tara:strand:- start:662 stop:1183 length:522 start_codon:yes stop_codon:yes gene_type:complete
MEDVPLHVIHLNQDDPKKCTARRMDSLGLVKTHDSLDSVPRRGFLLDPNSDTILGGQDKEMISLGCSLVVLDCSWKKVDSSLRRLMGNTMLEGRVLPLLLAANPVSWGKVGRLSSAEALAASLAILGRWVQARKILEPFQFGDHFFSLNKEPLDAYENATSKDSIKSLEKEFF